MCMKKKCSSLEYLTIANNLIKIFFVEVVKVLQRSVIFCYEILYLQNSVSGY